MPLLSERNKLYNRWLSTRQERDRLKYATARNVARLSVRHAKRLGLKVRMWKQKRQDSVEK